VYKVLDTNPILASGWDNVKCYTLSDT